MATIDESGLTAGKIRDRPINGRLRRVLLAAAADAGVDVVRVTSGGQSGSSGRRTGSNRHDGGAAAARKPPFDAILSAAGAIIPGGTGSLATLGLGIVLRQFGVKIVQRRL